MRALVLVASVATIGACLAAPAAAQPAVELAIAAVVAGGHDPSADRPLPARARSWLHTVYTNGASEPVWFDARGARPGASSALDALRAADRRGLAPPDYRVAELERLLAAATAAGRSPEQVARADVALTLATLRFLADLRTGRIAPAVVLPDYRPPKRDLPFAAALRAAVAADALSAAADAAEPAIPLYARLKRQLPAYRQLAAAPFEPLPPLPPKTAKLAVGDRYDGARALHARLVLAGDLPGQSVAPEDGRYTQELAEGVARFQARHALEIDGIVGKRTMAELNVPFERRLRRIELALERLRWLPDFPVGPVIAVNIPSFRLWVFDDLPASDRAALSMSVIVGRALSTQTPVFIGALRHLEFSPYWNVPPNILRNEILPALARDPGYLERHEMELVPVAGGGPPVTALDDATLAALRAGALRLRQRPGGANPLGGVKFVLPNAMDIYLHGTPAHQLFERSRRDFSHGCIRVADPLALTRFVLRDQPGWTVERIAAAMASGTTSTVRLTAPVPVVVFYLTAIAGNDARVHFPPDVYRQDVALEEALRAARGS